ncbi:HpcH/HpaI aldolase/citrate lyase family protein [Oceanicella sp. SM1341]|uniref:HpcH/HpaI aldolase family protein n=1 Tax=Oceanicella sp. SM1341 TaxID=1548889 RepID=UPI000E516771|nr:aldolase/citrate lyase family protein [Oceanicella sp. SM1341]
MSRVSLRPALAAGTPLIGAFAAIPSPMTVEILAASGPDFLCIDGEHSPIAGERLENMLRAAQVHGVPALVRVPGHAPEAIAAALDAGAAGILAPRVSTVAEARAVIEAARYPALGKRGAGPGRAALYGPGIPDYIARANDETVLAVQFETAEAVENAAEILALPGIDLAFIGPGDLAVTLAASGRPGQGALDAAIASLAAEIAASPVAAGIFAGTPEEARARIASGIPFVIMGSDSMVLGEALRSRFHAARA